MRIVSIVNAFWIKTTPVSSPQGGSGLARFCHRQPTENLHTQGRDAYGLPPRMAEQAERDPTSSSRFYKEHKIFHYPRGKGKIEVCNDCM